MEPEPLALSRIRAAGRGGLGVLAFKSLGLAFAFQFNILCTRKFGAQAWGLVSLTIAVVTIGSIVARFGVDTLALKWVSRSASSGVPGWVRGRPLVLAGVMGLLVGGVVWSCSGWIAELFDSPALAALVRAGAWAIPLLAVGLTAAQQVRGVRRYLQFAFLTYAARYLVAAGTLLLISAALGGDATAVVRAFVLGCWITGAAGAYLVFRSIPNTVAGSEMSWWRMLLAGSPFLLASSVSFLKGWGDMLVLGVLVSKTEVGLYSTALRVSGVLGLVIVAVNAVVAPEFARLFARGEVGRLSNLAKGSATLMLVLVLPAFVGCLVFAGAVLALFGSEFGSAQNALRILLVAQTVNVAAGSVGYLMQMSGLERRLQWVTILGVVVGIGGSFALVPYFGIDGAAWATLLSMVIWNGSCVWICRSRINVTSLPALRPGPVKAAMRKVLYG